MTKQNKAWIVLAAVALGLAGCGGGNDSFSGGSDTPTDTPPPDTGTPTVDVTAGLPRTIAVTWPETDAVENIGFGNYRRRGSIVVNDVNGIPVADGTNVYLNVIDTVFATGQVDTISGTTFTDANRTVFGAATGFADAYAIRNSQYRFIEADDFVLLNFGPAIDKIRSVASVPSLATGLTVGSPYSNSYPFAPYYPAATLDYVVGGSLLGVTILGVDTAGAVTAHGASATVDGVARFVIQYPANANTIHTGCIDASPTTAIDLRNLPAGTSSRVYVAAQVAGTDLAAVSDDFCFHSIAGGSISLTPTTLTNAGSVSVTIRDGGDHIELPYFGFHAEVVDSKATGTTTASNLFIADGVTGPAKAINSSTLISGSRTLTVTRVGAGGSGTTATIQFSYTDGAGPVTADLTVEIP